MWHFYKYKNEKLLWFERYGVELKELENPGDF